MHPNNPMTEGEALAVDAWNVLQIGARGSAYDPKDARRAFTYDHQPGNVVASQLGAATNTAANASAGDSIDRGLCLLKSLQDAGFGVFQIDPLGPSAAHTAASGGEVLAWRQRHPRVNGGDWMIVKRPVTPEDRAVGWECEPLYTAPPAAVPADALAHACDRVDRVIQYASDTLSGPEEPMSDRAGWYRGGVVEILRRVRAVKAELADIAALISKGADHEQR